MIQSVSSKEILSIKEYIDNVINERVYHNGLRNMLTKERTHSFIDSIFQPHTDFNKFLASLGNDIENIDNTLAPVYVDNFIKEVESLKLYVSGFCRSFGYLLRLNHNYTLLEAWLTKMDEKYSIDYLVERIKN